MLTRQCFKISLSASLALVLAASVEAANFTYDGINRRDPVGAVELNTYAAVGQIQCNRVATGEPRVSTGFALDIGQGDAFTLVMTAGHVLREQSDNKFNLGCQFFKNGSVRQVELEDKYTGNLVQQETADFIKNDWGATVLRSGPFMQSIPLSRHSFDELMQLLAADMGEIKLYARNQEPVTGNARVQVSDKCSIWQPTPNAILGAGHSLYTNCDSASSGSGGALVFEYKDGRVEAIGIMSGSVQTTTSLKRILGENTGNLSLEDVHHAIDLIPSPDTIINIAVPLIPDMRESALNALFDENLGL